MKRDWKIVKDLLGSYENYEAIEGLEQRSIAGHLALLTEGGYIKDGKLTWKGHDLLEQLRKEEFYEAALKR